MPAWAAGLALFLLYFSIIAAVQSSHVFEGMMGDDGGYVAPNTWEFSQHPLIPFLGVDAASRTSDTGHPLWFAWWAGIEWALFGQSTAILYLNLWCYGAWTLLLFHWMAQGMARQLFKDRAPRWTGYAAAACLLCHPVFISHTQMYVTMLPEAALFMTIIWLWSKNRRAWMTACLCIFPFFRITGAFFVLGLGLYDLAYLRWTRPGARAKDYALRLAPYALSALCVFIFFVVKLKAFKLPLSDYPGHELQWINCAEPAMKTAKDMLAYNCVTTWYYLVQTIPYSISLFFLPMLGAGVKWGVCKMTGRRKKIEVLEPPQTKPEVPVLPGFRGIAGAWGAALVFPLLFYIVYGHEILYSRYMAHQMLIMLLGLMALIYVFMHARVAALLCIVAWCGLQTARWHESWLRQLARGNQGVIETLSPKYWSLTQDIHLRKAIVQALADKISEGPAKVRCFGGFFTMGMIAQHGNGYLPYAIQWDSPAWIESENAVGKTFDEAARAGVDLIFVKASFDWASDRDAFEHMRAEYPAIALDASLTNEIGDTIDIYRLPARRGP